MPSTPLRFAVAVEYPGVDEASIRHLALVWAIIAGAYNDLSHHMKRPAAALLGHSRTHDNLVLQPHL